MAENNIHELTPKPLAVAISSRALFDLDESDEVFESQGLEAYAEYQVSREKTQYLWESYGGYSSP